MAQLTLKARKVKSINPKTKQEGVSARCVTNGKADFADICEMAGLNTTMNVAELEAAGKLILQAAARELKNGKIVDLGPLGGIYPSITSKWVENAEDLQKANLTAKVNYRPSDEIAAAIASAKLAWASAEEEKKEQENGGDNTTIDPDDNGGDDDNGGNGSGGVDTGGNDDGDE